MEDFSKSRYAHIYPTPLLSYELEEGPELNAQLRERILAHQAESGGVTKSNQGGWHSETGDLEFCGDAGKRLMGHMLEMANEATRRLTAQCRQEFQPVEWRLWAWANVNKKGDFNRVHVHPKATWSGTYYVDPGDPDDPKGGAPLHLLDPFPARNCLFLPSLPTTVYIYPKPSLMIIFPSYVPHMVFPHAGSGERISIAFNVRKEPFP